MDQEINLNWIKKASRPIALSRIALGGIIILSAILAFVNLRATGIGNEYYAAAVKSMSLSWKNFFFVAAEPGGSVSIDKPPLGLWLQVLSAGIFGFNGLALALPEIIAGILSVPLLYHLIRRIYGTGPGLLAALVLALTPISVAVMRVNMIDSVLVFVLLLSTWAFIKAAEGGDRRWLLVGGLLIGLGFNIKSLEAFLPVPAFFAAYFLGSPENWKKKLTGLGLTVILILIVSFAWVVIVDLTPANQRPFVGSTDHNSEIYLSIGYNGLVRLVGTSGPDVGPTGLLRLLRNPLAKDIGWLVPIGLVASLLTMIWLIRQMIGKPSPGSSWLNRLRSVSPLTRQQIGILIWGGWFLTGFVFFSAASFIHGYYLHTLAPPLAATIAISVWWIDRAGVSRIGWIALAALGALVFVYQMRIASEYGMPQPAVLLVILFVVVGLLLLISQSRVQSRFLVSQPAARISAGMVILLAFPLVWSILTMADPQPDTLIPSAYRAGQVVNGDQWPVVDQAFLSYLENQTHGMEYLVAVPNAVIGAPYVLASGRPVLFIGGFTGTDPVTNPQALSNLVKAGRLRFVWDLGELNVQKPAIAQWLASSCQVINHAPLPPIQTLGVPNGPVLPELPGGIPATFHQTLYACGVK